MKPEKANGVKFELFVFDALPSAPNPVVVETSRADDFSPVKNAEGVDSPATCRADQLRQFARWLRAAGATVPTADRRAAAVRTLEVSPLFGYDEDTFTESWSPLEPEAGDRGRPLPGGAPSNDAVGPARSRRSLIGKLMPASRANIAAYLEARLPAWAQASIGELLEQARLGRAERPLLPASSSSGPAASAAARSAWSPPPPRPGTPGALGTPEHAAVGSNMLNDFTLGGR